VAPASVNVDLRSLKAIFRLATRWGYICKNPFHDAALLQTTQNEPKFLSSEKYFTLVSNIRGDMPNSQLRPNPGRALWDLTKDAFTIIGP
jgi:hypothetical protein